MTKSEIKVQVKSVVSARADLEFKERKLGDMAWEFLEPRGSMHELARKLNVSVGYVCDIAHGRRKVSSNIVDKLLALKGE